MNTRLTCTWLLLGALFLVAVPSAVHAQDRGGSSDVTRKKSARKASGKLARAKAAKAKAEAEKPHTAEANANPPVETKGGHSAAPPVTTEGDVHKEGGTDVKVLEFSGLDIEGQLKTPQMLYFLRRLRAEFDRPGLPHRSFLPELEQTTKDEAF